ncbi:acyltransferase family protein [Gynuella sunshinyii]|uniref:Putative acyltransferase n=1 Tax=Gynuella sunshinyii YC6258 TaxID=1445510 RepID=A0A0C5VTA9_9GAMM|nr:acyltransferase [Gynuella sunshinyii]AJQ96558.1 putative acyltransferase [Gynuella sunshinyii YC6258]
MKRLELLDYGRFFAALMVVAFHYTFNGIVNGKINSINHIPSVIEVTKYGYLGVELFFMISGYVIFFSAKNRTAAMFAESRAIRLYPAYWFAILFTSFFALQWGGDLMSVYPGQIVANFTMVQSLVGIDNVDGVYWTLVYEISFYFAVFILLFFGLQKHLETIFVYWPFLFCIALVFGLQSKPYLGGYYYYFAAGALFASIANRFNRKAVVSLMVTYAFCINFSAGKAAHLSDVKGVEYSGLVIALIVTSFFAIFIYQNSKNGRLVSLPMSRIAGALTYPVYLIHAHFGYMFINRFATEENKIVIYAVTVSIVLIAALSLHLIVEKHFHFVWKKLFYYTVSCPINYFQRFQKKFQVRYQNPMS